MTLFLRLIIGDARRRRAGLPLVLGAEPWRAVRPIHRGGQAQKADLRNAHAVIEGDRHLRLVGKLEGELVVTLKTRNELSRRRSTEAGWMASRSNGSTSMRPAANCSLIFRSLRTAMHRR